MKTRTVTLADISIGGDSYWIAASTVPYSENIPTYKVLPLSSPPEENFVEYSLFIKSLLEHIFQNYVKSRCLATIRDTLLPCLMAVELEAKV